MDRIAAFTLPLDCCPTENQRGRSTDSIGYKRAKVKTKCWKIMLAQYMKQFRRLPPAPRADGVYQFPDKTLVICTRRSYVEPDPGAWCKAAIDLLQVPRANRKHGLSLIYDDGPKYTTIEQRWERAPRGLGSVTIEVYA